jgi:hypothetical protein
MLKNIYLHKQSDTFSDCAVNKISKNLKEDIFSPTLFLFQTLGKFDQQTLEKV